MALKASTAQDIMTENVEVLRQDDTLLFAAQRLAQNDVGALPVCDRENHLRGILTDRDIVVQAIAQGKDPRQTTVGEIATSDTVTVTPDAPVRRVTELMAKHQIRRLPVIEDDEIVGMISQADIARAVPADLAGRMLGHISED
jgi:CBS domain-containing protein